MEGSATMLVLFAVLVLVAVIAVILSLHRNDETKADGDPFDTFSNDPRREESGPPL